MPSSYWRDDVRSQEAAAILADPVGLREIVEAGFGSEGGATTFANTPLDSITGQSDAPAMAPVAFPLVNRFLWRVQPEEFLSTAGNGVVNATAAVQAAINTGRRVWLSKGSTYKLSSAGCLYVPTSANGGAIEGSGKLLRGAEKVGARLGVLNLEDVDGYEILGIEIDGAKASYVPSDPEDPTTFGRAAVYCIGQSNSKYARNIRVQGTYIHDCDAGVFIIGALDDGGYNYHVIDNRIEELNGHGILINANSSSGSCNDAWIERNRILNYGLLANDSSGGGPAITHGRNSRGSVVRGNVIRSTTPPAGNSAHGISMEAEDGVVSDNLVDGATGFGCEVANSGVGVSNNRFKNCDRPGVFLVAGSLAVAPLHNSHSNVTITGNRITDCGGGVFTRINDWDGTDRHTHVAIVGNTVIGTKASATAQSYARGIEVQHTDGVIIDGNRVHGCYKAGIWVEGSSGESITASNVVTGNNTSATGSESAIVVKAESGRALSQFGNAVGLNISRLTGITSADYLGACQTYLGTLSSGVVSTIAALQGVMHWGGEIWGIRTAQRFGRDVVAFAPNIVARDLKISTFTPDADTAANIASVAATINTTNKSDGRIVYDATNSRYMRATGALAASPWKTLDGVTTVTPS